MIASESRERLFAPNKEQAANIQRAYDKTMGKNRRVKQNVETARWATKDSTAGVAYWLIRWKLPSHKKNATKGQLSMTLKNLLEEQIQLFFFQTSNHY